MKDGSDYTHSSDGENMYSNRDSRLAAIIGYDGSVYGKILFIRELVIIQPWMDSTK